MVTTITELAGCARSAAEQEVTYRHKKKASFRLYGVLAQCMAICERCQLNDQDLTELKELFASQPPDEGNKRRYIEKGSDVFLLTCRYVFHGSYLTNASRYAHCLRQAAKLQINSSDLANWMRNNGGINALYFRRPLDRGQMRIKCLHLTRTIEFPRDGSEFTIHLRWNQDNTFTPIGEEQ